MLVHFNTTPMICPKNYWSHSVFSLSATKIINWQIAKICFLSHDHYWFEEDESSENLTKIS